IISISCPGHIAYLLQPIGVEHFTLLQKSNSEAVVQHKKETHTAIAIGLFWTFYCTAETKAYTNSNIYSVWCATGYLPYNPNTLLMPLH
ncbi:hypothetical protein BDD12DRAFT_679563, partial [Trichophaea hybrida]